MEAEDRNVSLITENIAGVHVVKAFATEQQEIAKYDAHCDSYLGKVRRRIRIFADFTPVIRSIASGSYLTLFLAAGILMIRGHLLAGDFLVLGQAMAQILTRLQVVSTINEQYQNAMVSSRRLYEVLHAPATVPEKPAAAPLPPGPGRFLFERVAFGYKASAPVLRDVNFRNARREHRGDCRSDGSRQDHAGEPARPFLRPAAGTDPDRRRGHP